METTANKVPADINHRVFTAKKEHLDQKNKEGKELLNQQTNTVVATASFLLARQNCIEKVEKIAEECKQHNKRFRDRKFDLFNDPNACLYSYAFRNFTKWSTTYTRSLRLGKIYKDANFFGASDKPEANDIMQGIAGNCWFLSALSNATSIYNLLETICVARDEEVGIYGFIFFKDGDWISTVVDDQLALKADDKHGEKILMFSSSTNNLKSWVPLIEKAFAKIHGDYESIEGGHVGEGVEDLTGGVSTQFFTADILDEDKFWAEEMRMVNKDRLIGMSHHTFYKGDSTDNNLIDSHAYCVLDIYEGDGVRLVKVRNPWGDLKGEWNGDWSDGSDKWTPEWLEKLNYRFANDGTFWMSYSDFLSNYQYLDRTRLFNNHDWHVATQWINYNVVPESGGRFELNITADNEPTIIVLSKQDNRYMTGEKRYLYEQSFYVYEKGKSGQDYLFRSSVSPLRSINLELVLSSGTYEIVPKLARTEIAGDENENIYRKHFAKFKETEANASLGMGGIEKLTAPKTTQEEEDTEKEGTRIAAEAEEGKAKWEIMIGVRVYSKDSNFTVIGNETPDEMRRRTDPEEDVKLRAMKIPVVETVDKISITRTRTKTFLLHKDK